MPISWMPRIKTIEEQIAEEQARLWRLREPEVTEEELPIAERPRFTPTAWRPTTAVAEPEPTVGRMPAPIYPTPAPTIKKPPTIMEEEPISVPFWQRALQVFAAPFVWVEENVIKPGLSLAGTAAGAVPEVKREPGEDFWEWKKRSWEQWKAPGFEFNVPWSDRPQRIDIKGVLELAPWLLIPGAGQVGTGARAARGIAGLVGKIAKPLGYAIEYSPWGLVEKTAGVAMRAGIKAMGKSAEAVSGKLGKKVFGEIVEPPVSPAEKKLTTLFDEAVIPAREVFEKEFGIKQAKVGAVLETIWARQRRGEISATKATELAEKARAALEPVKEKFAIRFGRSGMERFTKEETEDLLSRISKATERGYTTTDDALALRDLLMTGALPEPHHIKAFAQVYGEEFAKSVGKFARLPVTTKGQILDALNLPRAVLASGDLSATFRQGLILNLTRPQDVPRSFWRQLKYFASEKLALEMDDALRARPLHGELVNKMGIEFTSIQRGARMVAKEEPFFSNMAQRIPLVRPSERGFTGFLNEMREGAGEAAYHALTAQGATPAQFKLMGQFINLSSGRGKLPANLDRYAPVLNAVMFSAKYQMSTLQLPRQLGRMFLSGNPYMRREAAKALITFVGGGSALLGLLKASGKADVEIDPRSGDFGKIIFKKKVGDKWVKGDTRLDIWRGYVQYARFMAQMLTGERKSAYGNMNKATRWEIAIRFLQSKASPAAGLIADIWKGENYMGEPLFNETTGFSKMARDRLLPLALQDVMDAMEQSGTNGLWTAAPATLGIGVLTYVNDFVRVKEKIAREMGYETWDEIDPATQRRLENSNTELQVATIAFDRQVMGTAWGDWNNAGKAIEDTFTENVGLATNQYRDSVDPNKGIEFREKIGDAFTARRGGYDAREKMPQFEDIVKRLKNEDTAEALLALGPEQLAIRLYNEALYGEDMYDEYGDYRFDLADIRKDELRRQLGNEMFEYVEEYRGIKHEDLPAEFQELTKAKKVMKPYWDVYDWAVKTFGQAWADSSRGQAFISRMRKQMRLTNPEIAKYYDMFYKRS